MENRTVIFETNDIGELDEVKDLLSEGNIAFSSIEDRDDPILGQSGQMYRFKIYVSDEHYDLASELIGEYWPDGAADEPTERTKTYADLSDYYDEIFVRFDSDATYRNMTWNWASCLLTWIWYIYNRMYFSALGILVVCIGIGFLSQVLSLLLLCMISIYVGIFGNYHKYRKYKERDV